jgi:hypothetical protein
MPQRPPSAPKRSINGTYFAAVTIGSIALALFPIGLLLASFALGGFSGNAFDENGAGVALWLLIVTLPAGLAFFVAGVLVGVVIELVRALRR